MSTSLSVDLLADLGSNNVEFSLAFRGDNSGHSLFNGFLVLLDDAQAFELLKSISDDFSAGSGVVWLSDTVSLLSTEQVLHGADTDVLSEVDFSGNSS